MKLAKKLLMLGLAVAAYAYVTNKRKKNDCETESSDDQKEQNTEVKEETSSEN